MKKIETLVEDIYSFVNGDLTEYINDNLNDFSSKMGEIYGTRLQDNKHTPDKDDGHHSSLRMSSIGTPCIKKLWYKQANPDQSEGVNPSTRLKFLFGDVLEVLLLQLVRDSGHTIEGEQDELVVNGLKGHRDAVIDGVTIDCKSASSFSFKKFKEGLKSESDVFGYLKQLESYVTAAQKDPLVKDKNRGGFLVIDKQHGHIHLDLHNFEIDEGRLSARIDYLRSVVDNADVTPDRPKYSDIEDGKSGNRKLGVACSYCDFKQICWPSLRTFIYSNGPKYLTKTVRVPDVFEIKKV